MPWSPESPSWLSPRFYGKHVVSWERSCLLSPHFSGHAGGPPAAEHRHHRLREHVGRVLGQPHLHGKPEPGPTFRLSLPQLQALGLLDLSWLEDNAHELGTSHPQQPQGFRQEGFSGAEHFITFPTGTLRLGTLRRAEESDRLPTWARTRDLKEHECGEAVQPARYHTSPSAWCTHSPIGPSLTHSA